MSKKKDWISLGEAYKDVFKKVIVNEEVPVGQIGEAPLETGGPKEEGGFRPPLVDITKLSDKDKEDNIYNIRGLTYGDGNEPGINNQQPDPTGPEYAQVPYTGVVGNEEDEEGEVKNKKKADLDKDGKLSEYEKKRGKAIEKSTSKGGDDEEDEEILAEHEKIARSGLNNFMSKSVFDKLYNKVMVSESFGENAEDVTELDALGIETETDVEFEDEVPEEITVSVPGELAQTLCDILQTALAQQETEVEVDVDVTDVTDTEFEEDEEAVMKDGGGYGVDAGSTLKGEVNYGKGGQNKVSNLKPAGAAKQKDGGGYGVDAGSTLHHKVDHALKNNKVGSLAVGKNAFE
jgi:hypothetical protein|tara:strand:+ start:603 stop:1643 length:1041 start_codon:yes stop_codon:yes gene_type:complete